MKNYSIKDISRSLNKIPLKKGDCIYINPELFRFGKLINATKNNFYKIFYEIIRKKIGNSGTISINTFSFQVLRKKKIFNHEKTVTTSGEFSEFIRNLPGSVRSDHPVFSVCSIGRKKNIISKNNSWSNFGSGSPFQRFMSLNGKILNLGMDYHLNPFFHVAEFNTGVPYLYNKLTRVKYYKNNKKINKDFVSTVRYLNLKLIGNHNKLKKKLKEIKIYKSRLGQGYIYFYKVNDYYKVIKELLEKSFYNLHKKNIGFKKGFFPYK